MVHAATADALLVVRFANKGSVRVSKADFHISIFRATVAAINLECLISGELYFCLKRRFALRLGRQNTWDLSPPTDEHRTRLR